MKAEVESQLKEHPLFSSLADEARAAVMEKAQIHVLDGGDVLYPAGEKAHSIFFLVSGAVQVEYPKDGEDRGYVTAMLRAPASVGECQAIHGSTWSSTISAVTQSIAIGVPTAELLTLMETYPAFGVNLYKELTYKFLCAIDAWKDKMDQTPAETLSRYLLGYMTVTRESTGETGPLRLRLTQAGLATASGLRRETINRLLKKWENDGWLEREGHTITNIKEDELRKLVSEEQMAEMLQSTELWLDRPEINE